IVEVPEDCTFGSNKRKIFKLTDPDNLRSAAPLAAFWRYGTEPATDTLVSLPSSLRLRMLAMPLAASIKIGPAFFKARSGAPAFVVASGWTREAIRNWSMAKVARERSGWRSGPSK